MEKFSFCLIEASICLYLLILKAEMTGYYIRPSFKYCSAQHRHRGYVGSASPAAARNREEKWDYKLPGEREHRQITINLSSSVLTA